MYPKSPDALKCRFGISPALQPALSSPPRAGDQPMWARDGSHLFFVNPQGRLQSVRVDDGRVRVAADLFIVFLRQTRLVVQKDR